MKKKLEFLSKMLVYATFFVPLVVVSSSFIFPFIVPKIIIFRSLVIAMIACYIALLAINKKEYSIKSNLLNLTVLLFLTSFLVSTFAGVDAYKSFWDNHERMLGLFTIFHYVAFYFICGDLFKKWADWQMALKIFSIAGSLVMFVGFLQIFSPYMLMNNGSERVASTLGNAIYVGGYALFLLFTNALLLFREESKIWRIILSGCLLLALIGLFFSGTRGTMLGLVVGAGATIFGYALFFKEKPKMQKGLWGLLGGLVLLVLILFLNRQSDFVKNIPAVGRAVNTTWTEVKNTPRWVAWEIAVESWKEKPVFGWGPNNYYYAFNQYYNPKLLNYGYGETWFDNSHNILLNTLAVQGVVGFLSYLAIFVAAIYLLIRGLVKKQVNLHLALLGSGFLIAHLVQNITVFENPTSYLYFMFWLAMISSLAGKKEANEENQIVSDKKLSNGFLVTLSIFTFLFVFIFNIQPARANMRTLKAVVAINNLAPNAVEIMNEALSFSSPHIDDIRNDIGRTAATVLRNPPRQLDVTFAKELADTASDELEKNTTLHPRDIRVFIQLSQLYEVRAKLYNDMSYLQNTEAYWQSTIQYSPKRQQAYYSFSTFKLQTNRVDEAVKLLEQTIVFNPRIAEGYWRLAYIYKVEGDMEKSNEYMNKLKSDPDIIITENDKASIEKIEQMNLNQVQITTST